MRPVRLEDRGQAAGDAVASSTPVIPTFTQSVSALADWWNGSNFDLD